MSMGNHIIHAEWIGKHAKVAKSTNKHLETLEGTIVDETKHTVTIETPTGTKKVPKKGTTFIINGHTIEGDLVITQSHERIKLKET